jgi:capsular polysaccharide export protein
MATVVSHGSAEAGPDVAVIATMHPEPFWTVSRALSRLTDIDVLVGAPVKWTPFGAISRVAGDGVRVLGWGRKPSGNWAARQMLDGRVAVALLEDGFLRSVASTDRPLSLVIDDLGIYYDAQAPSRLDRLLDRPLTEEALQRADAVVSAWRSARVSKYNDVRSAATPGGRVCDDAYVVVADQTWGDLSVRYGRGSPQSFARMLEAAIDEHPGCRVLLKTHPEVVAGRRKGYFDRLSRGMASRVELIGACHAPDVIEHAQAVYVVTSQLGFEALLWRRPVRVFGMPFYAGRGLTRDELPSPDWRKSVSANQLWHAALIDYPVYVDAERRRRCEIEDVLAHLALQRAMRDRFASQIVRIGFSAWKKPIASAFFAGSRMIDSRDGAGIGRHATVAVWGRRAAPPASAVIRVEDGFLRSVGLGAAFTQPLSWVQDDIGIYYDATSQSRLERILATTVFDAALLERASALRRRIVEAGLTKYNLNERRWIRPDTQRKIILVPGQVETDASLRYGAAAVNTNEALLRAVKAAEPQALIVYKLHPDVASGLRGDRVREARLRCLSDVLLDAADMAHLLQQVDEVHTMTSLAGFEALLQGRKVVTYGMPFYAGWGLTDDLISCRRRARLLTIDELTAGALILYPTYVSSVTGAFMSPEKALDELMRERTQAPQWKPAAAHMNTRLAMLARWFSAARARSRSR